MQEFMCTRSEGRCRSMCFRFNSAQSVMGPCAGEAFVVRVVEGRRRDSLGGDGAVAATG